MASTISSKTSGVGGLTVTGDASGVLQLASANGTTAVTIDASQNVGIGTSSPYGILSVSQNTNAQSWLTLRNTNAGSSASSGVLFGNDANAAYGAIYVNSSTNTGFGGANSINLGSYGAYPLTFLTSSAERMRIDSTGQQSSTIVGFAGTYNEYKCRAWVNFNGTGVVAIRASGNVSSITDNGVSDYTVNFTTAMPDANYSIVGGTTGTGIAASTYPQPIAAKRQTDMLTTSCRIYALTGASSGTVSLSDPEVVNVAVFR